MTLRGVFDVELGRNARPALMTFAGVLMFSFMPLAIAFAGRDGPFFFLLNWRLGLGAGIGVLLAWRYRDLLFSREIWQAAMRPGRRWMIALSVVGYTDILLFTLASTRVDISVATILYELNPIIFVFFLVWLYRKEGRYRGISLMNVVSFWLALIGVVFVVMAQEEGFGGFGRALRDLGFNGLGNTLIGSAFGIGSAVVIAFSAYSFKWGSEFAAELPVDGRSARDKEFFGLIFCAFICNALSLPLLVGGMLFTGEMQRLASGDMIGVSARIVALSGFGWGLLVHTAAMLLRYLSLQLTTNLGINVIRYLLPLLALAWLFAADAFWDADLVGDIDMLTLIIGLGVILAANLGVFIDDAQFDKDERFKPLNAAEAIRGGESERVAFQPRLWREVDGRGEFDAPGMEAVARAICGMLNGDGGAVIIGVAEGGAIEGMGEEREISADRHTRFLMRSVRAALGRSAARRIKVEYDRHRGRRLCFVYVARGNAPTYALESDERRFYARSERGGAALSGDELDWYIAKRF